MTRRLIGILLLAIVSYGLLEAWPLLVGPVLRITSPTDYAPISEGMVTISGKVSRVSLLSLNGAPILHDQEGNFSSTLTVAPGGSILTFVAADRFGRRITETRTIYAP